MIKPAIVQAIVAGHQYQDPHQLYGEDHVANAATAAFNGVVI